MDGTTPVNGRVFVDMGPGGSDGIRTDRDSMCGRQPAAWPFRIQQTGAPRVGGRVKTSRKCLNGSDGFNRLSVFFFLA